LFFLFAGEVKTLIYSKREC